MTTFETIFSSSPAPVLSGGQPLSQRTSLPNEQAGSAVAGRPRLHALQSVGPHFFSSKGPVSSLRALSLLLSFILLFPALMLLSSSCETLGSEEVEATLSPGYQCVLSFTVQGEELVESKAGDISADSTIDDKIYRLDLLVFDGASPYSLLSHETFTGEGTEPLDLSSVSYTEYAIRGTKRNFLALVNLDSDSVDYVKQYLVNQGNGSENYTYVPLSAGNYSSHRLPMVGGAMISNLTSDVSLPVRLYRPLFRIEIDKITADFQGDFAYLMDSDVKVRTIALINAVDMMTLLQACHPSAITNSAEAFFGPTLSMYKPFGYSSYKSVHDYPNRMEYFAYDLPLSYSLSSLGGEGLLSRTYTTFYNYNVNAGKGVLNISGPQALVDDATHVYDTANGEGVLVDPTDPSNGELTVNKVLYAVPSAISEDYGDVFCDYSSQDSMTKLVIEVLIDGRTYFYPIPMKYPQPNTSYHISNITLKGLGSEYSNFFEKQYRVTNSSPVVVQWTTTTVSNTDVGYTTEIGEAIY